MSRLVATPGALLASPFRPFFLLAAAYAVLVMAAWLSTLLGGPSPPLAMAASQWHAHEMLFGVVPAAIAGFLLTAAANWTGTPPTAGGTLLALVALWLVGRVAMWSGSMLPLPVVAALDLAFLPALAAHVGRLLLGHGNRRNLPLAGLLLGLALTNLVVHVASWGARPDGTRVGEVLALDLVAVLMVVIGGRITPAFTANWLRLQGRDPAAVRTSPVLDRWAALATLLVVPADLPGVPAGLAAGAAALAAAINALRLLRWRGWLAAREPLLWVLHLGLAWVVAALALKALAPLVGLGADAWIHALGGGAVGTLVLGVMTRVALGHTGRALRLPRGAVLVYVAVSVAALARVAGALQAVDYRTALVLAAGAWVLAFAAYLAWFGPILCRPRADGRPG